MLCYSLLSVLVICLLQASSWSKGVIAPATSSPSVIYTASSDIETEDLLFETSEVLEYSTPMPSIASSQTVNPSITSSEELQEISPSSSTLLLLASQVLTESYNVSLSASSLILMTSSQTANPSMYEEPMASSRNLVTEFTSHSLHSRLLSPSEIMVDSSQSGETESMYTSPSLLSSQTIDLYSVMSNKITQSSMSLVKLNSHLTSLTDESITPSEIRQATSSIPTKSIDPFSALSQTASTTDTVTVSSSAASNQLTVILSSTSLSSVQTDNLSITSSGEIAAATDQTDISLPSASTAKLSEVTIDATSFEQMLSSSSEASQILTETYKAPLSISSLLQITSITPSITSSQISEELAASSKSSSVNFISYLVSMTYSSLNSAIVELKEISPSSSTLLLSASQVLTESYSVSLSASSSLLMTSSQTANPSMSEEPVASSRNLVTEFTSHSLHSRMLSPSELMVDSSQSGETESMYSPPLLLSIGSSQTVDLYSVTSNQITQSGMSFVKLSSHSFSMTLLTDESITPSEVRQATSSIPTTSIDPFSVLSQTASTTDTVTVSSSAASNQPTVILSSSSLSSLLHFSDPAPSGFYFAPTTSKSLLPAFTSEITTQTFSLFKRTPSSIEASYIEPTPSSYFLRVPTSYLEYHFTPTPKPSDNVAESSFSLIPSDKLTLLNSYLLPTITQTLDIEFLSPSFMFSSSDEFGELLISTSNDLSSEFPWTSSITDEFMSSDSDDFEPMPTLSFHSSIDLFSSDLTSITDEFMSSDSDDFEPTPTLSFHSSIDLFSSDLTSITDEFVSSDSDDFEPTPTLSFHSSIDLFSSDFLMTDFMTSFIPSPSPSVLPQIVSLVLGPANVTANYLETVVLSCTFSSPFRLDDVDLIWYNNFEEINETLDRINITTSVYESEDNYNVSTVFSLTIEDVMLDDQGYYECGIDDDDYADIRGIAYLTVTSITDEFMSSDSDDFEPTPTLSFHSSIDLFSSDFLMTDFMTSFIPSPSPSVLPQIVSLVLGPANVTANYLETVVLSCTFSSPFRLDDVDLIWYNNFEEVNETLDRINITTSVYESEDNYNVSTVFSLTIEDVMLDDQGYYKCGIDDEDYADIRGIAYLTVQKPPTINASEDTVVVNEGDEVVLLVTVSGGVPPVNEEDDVQWLFTGFDGVASELTNESCNCNVTSSNEAYTLTLYSVLRADRGNYTLVVHHPTGTHKVNIELIVNVPPCATIANYSTRIIVNVTDDVEIQCTVESYPQLENDIEWYSLQNGTFLLQNSSKYLIDYSGTESNETDLVFTAQSQILITDVNLNDDGVYICSGGPESTCNATFSIIVQAPASISSVDNTSIVYGIASNNITLKFVLNDSGVPPLLPNDTQWIFNGTESLEEETNIIFSDDRLSLTLSNLTFANEGNYTIIITNPAGTDSATLFLDVEGLLSAKNEEITVAENDNVTIGFIIEGDGPVYQVDNFVWYFTAKLSNVKQKILNERYSIASDLRSLTITSAQLEDRGNYTLEINENRSATGSLDVKVAPRLRNDKGKNYNVNISHSNVTFNCSAYGVPIPIIQWIRNGNAVFQSNRFSISSSGDTNQSIHEKQEVYSILIVSDVQLYDAGNYTCKADNSFGVPASLSIDYTLNVTDNRPPPFCLREENNNECGTNGMCKDLPGGQYECICINGFSGDKCNIFVEPSFQILELQRVYIEYDREPLNVLPPFPKTTTQYIPARLFNKLTMVCYSEGIPYPETTWYKDGQPMTSNEKVFEIQEVKQSDRGYYECVVNNTFKGEAKYQMTGRFLVNITGVVAYKIIIVITEETHNATTISEMIRNDILNTRIDNAIVISVKLLKSQRARRKRNTEELDIVITLFFDEDESQSQGLQTEHAKDSLKMKLESEGFTVSNVTRFDGCQKEVTYINGEVLEWPESNIGDTVVISCPCGGIDLSSTGLTTSRKCGGLFETGAQWEDPMNEKCNFTETTKAICELAGKPSNEKVEQLGRLTEATANFQPAEVITATVVLLTASQDAEGNFNLSKGFLNVVNNIASVDIETLRTSQEDARVTTKLMDSLQNVSEALPIETEDQPVILLEESFVVLAQGVNRDSFEANTLVASLKNDTLAGDSLELVDNRNGTYSNSTASLTLPPNLLNNLTTNNNSTDKIVSIAFQNDTLFLRRTSATRHRQLGSIILSASVAGEERIDNLTNPTVNLQFQLIKIPQRNFTVSCVYWDAGLDDGFGDWSSDGCIVNETEYMNDSSRVLCHCNHLTSFAIIMDLTPQEVPTDPTDYYSTTLSAITYIGIIVSTFCLLVTISTFLSVKKLRRTEHGQLLIQLSLALIGLYIVFIGASLSIHSPILCLMTAVMLHYFFLVVFVVTAAEAVNLYMKLVVVLGRKISYFGLKATLVSWILPIFIVLFSFAPDYTNFYQHNYFCRPYNVPFYVGMIAPFVFIYIFNWTVFIVILARLMKRREVNPSHKNSKSKKIKQEIIAAMALSVLLGLGWGFGVPASSQFFQDTPPIQKTFEILFVALTSFQGFAVFVTQCMRSLDARNVWTTWYRNTLRRYTTVKSRKFTSSVVSKGEATKSSGDPLSTCPEIQINRLALDSIEKQEYELKSYDNNEDIFEHSQAEDSADTIMKNPGYIS